MTKRDERLAMPFDGRICTLGEGPLWHPERQQFFWFDIMECRLLTPGAEWSFEQHVSAAGWVDRDRLLIASQTGLLLFDLETGTRDFVAPLEADNPATRSNDGRADPMGGFWIGTMGIGLEPGAGAYYRYYRGELRLLWGQVSIPNCTCFHPDGRHACFTDTPTQVVSRVRLDAHGWPVDDPETLLDFRGTDLNPDGAVIDAEGTLWIAFWGTGQVRGYDMDGGLVGTVKVPALQTTCPAFGGPDLTQMLVTSAAENLAPAALAARPESGMTFLFETRTRGQAEHQVIL
jgi:sugar lactone lactonase YvrE